MAKWTDRPLITTFGDDFTVLGMDPNRTSGDRDGQFPLGPLREFLGAGISVGVTQAAHGFSVGDVVRFDGADYVQATADTAANSEAVGVVTTVPDAGSFTYQTAGVVGTLSGLTPGDLYYLQDDGSLGTSAGTVEKPILIATSATSAVLILAISGAGGGGGGGGSGDVVGPASATDGNLVVFDGTTGKLVKDGGPVPTGSTGIDINAQTGTTYTLVLADAQKLVTLTNGSAITLTVPANGSVAFPVGTVIALAQLGAGLVTVEGASGVTINGTTPGDEDLSGQWATATLTKVATNTWLLSGGLA